MNKIVEKTTNIQKNLYNILLYVQYILTLFELFIDMNIFHFFFKVYFFEMLIKKYSIGKNS